MAAAPVESCVAAATSTVTLPAWSAFTENVNVKPVVAPFALVTPENCGLVVVTTVLVPGEAQILVYEGESCAKHFFIQSSPSKSNFAGIGFMNVSKDLDQRRLAGTIGAEQRMDLARVDAEIDTPQCARSSEMFDNADAAQNWSGIRDGRRVNINHGSSIFSM